LNRRCPLRTWSQSSSEAGGEVEPLLADQIEAGEIVQAVGLGGSGAMGLLGGVVELEREDGESIDE